MVSMRKSALVVGLALVVLAFVGGLTALNAGIAYRNTADIRVWLEEDYDVYQDMDDVVFHIRAARGCYALVYVVDTDGFVHVIYPFSPHENAWIEGGVTYRFSAFDVGMYGFDFNRGIAFVYAIGSPYPFNYSCYGANIFAGRFAYRIYGDPFVACRLFYISLLPVWCDRAVIGISFTHFYIREWVRYPSYLCFCNGASYRIRGGYCSHCAPVYERYRSHQRDPYRVLSPKVRYRGDASAHARIAPVPEKRREAIRAKLSRFRTATPSNEKERVLREKTIGTKKIIREKSRAVEKNKGQRSIKMKPATKKSSTSSRLVAPKKAVRNKDVRRNAQKSSVVRSSSEIVKKERSRTVALKQKAQIKTSTPPRAKTVSAGKTSKAKASVAKAKRSVGTKASKKAR